MGPKVSKPHLFIGASTTETSFGLQSILPVCQGGWKMAFSWNSCVGSATHPAYCWRRRKARREDTPSPRIRNELRAPGGPVPSPGESFHTSTGFPIFRIASHRARQRIGTS